MLQGSEIIIILLLALVVLGPQRLPGIARKLGAWSAELRRAASDLRSGLEAEVGDLRSIGDDLKQTGDDFRRDMQGARESMENTTAEVSRLGWIGPDPVSGPKASDALADLDRIEGVEAGTPEDKDGDSPRTAAPDESDANEAPPA